MDLVPQLLFKLFTVHRGPKIGLFIQILRTHWLFCLYFKDDILWRKILQKSVKTEILIPVPKVQQFKGTTVQQQAFNKN